MRSMDAIELLKKDHQEVTKLFQRFSGGKGARNGTSVVEKICDELDVHAPRPVRRNRDFYLSDPRPPVLKDYFHPALVRRLRLALTTKQVRVRYSFEEMDMP